MEAKPWHRHYDYNVPTTIRYPRIPAQAIFQLAAGTFPDRTATKGEIVDFCRERLTAYKVPRLIEFSPTSAVYVGFW